jgi:hypothetical protein
MIKIYETKEIQNKIWGFLNLKFIHFVHKIQKIHDRLICKIKKETFDLIHLFSIQINAQPKVQTPIVEKMEPIKTRIEITKTINYEPLKT